MEQELTMEELIALINSQKGDFVIRVEFGEDVYKRQVLSYYPQYWSFQWLPVMVVRKRLIIRQRNRRKA